MRIAAFIGATVLTTILIGSATAILVVFGKPDTLWVILTSLAVAPLLLGPVLLGSLAAYWDSRTSPGSRAAYRRWVLVTLVADVAGAVVLVLFSVLTPAPWWIPVVLIGVGAIVTAAAPTIGRELYRSGDVESGGPTTVDVAKKIRATVIVFVATLVVGSVLLIPFFNMLGMPDALAAILFALAFALFAGAITSMVTIVPLNRGVRAILGDDLARAQKIARVVLRGKDIPLDDGEKRAAAEYAHRVPTALGFQIASFTMLYAGLLLTHVPRILSGFDALTTIVTVIFAVGLVVLVPVQFVQLRRVQRYAREHPVTLVA